MSDKAELTKRRRYLEVVLESAPDAIVTLDPEHRIIDWNKGARELFGYSKEEVAGRNVDDLITVPEIGDEARHYTDTVLSGRSVAPVETVRYRKDGTPVDVLLSGAPIIVDGELMGVIGVYTDITERKKYESEVIKSRRLETVGTLAGGIAHDFNNLLSGIFGNMSLISASLPGNSPARPYLEAVERSMGQAVGLTHQLLTFARGSQPVVEPLDTGTLVRDSVQFNLAGSSVRPVFRIPENTWMIMADGRQIGQVISNLVINSKEAMPEGGELLVTVENVSLRRGDDEGLETGEYVRLDFRDSGEGIDRRHIERIFEPFYSTRSNGSGLGLAVVHSIVTKHGGAASVTSEPGEGTTVSVWLPAAETSGVQREAGGCREAEGSCSGSCRILLMDDEEYIRDVASSMLRALGHDPDTVEDGAEAVRTYRKAMESGRAYDLVILDLTVPGEMGGRDTARELLSLDPAAVLVVSSGYSTDPVMADHSRYGFSGVLAKPYTLAEMKSLVDSLVRG